MMQDDVISITFLINLLICQYCLLNLWKRYGFGLGDLLLISHIGLSMTQWEMTHSYIYTVNNIRLIAIDEELH